MLKPEGKEKERGYRFWVHTGVVCNIGALITTYTMLGVPYYKYSMIYPQNPILNYSGPYIRRFRFWGDLRGWSGCRGLELHKIWEFPTIGDPNIVP